MRIFHILIMFILLTTNYVNAAQMQVYVVNLKYENGVITLENVEMALGFFEPVLDQPQDGYKVEIISFDGSVIYEERFNFAFIIGHSSLPEWFDENNTQIVIPNETSYASTDTSAKELTLPYFPDAKQINVYSPEGIALLEINVEQFASMCGNNVCDSQENYATCSQDCPSGSDDNYCDTVEDGVCDLDCSAGADIDCGLPFRINMIFVSVAIGTVVLIAAVFAYMKASNSGNKFDVLKKKYKNS